MTTTIYGQSIVKKVNLLLGITLVLFLIFGSGENKLSLIYAFATLAVIINLFLIKQPVILFTLSYHFLQITAKLFYAEFNNVSINTLTAYSVNADMAQALHFSCIGLIFLSTGIYFFLQKKPSATLTSFNIKKLLILYIVIVFIEILASLIGQLGGFYQLIIKVTVLKWGVLFLITYMSIKEKKYHFLIAVIIFEILSSLLSYFSTFKDVLFITLISFLILNSHYYKIKSKYFFVFGGLAVVMILTWQNVKEDYRSFLSDGKTSQMVSVGFEDAYDKMFDLVSENSNTTLKTIDKTIDRISYIDFFAESINYIPEVKSHTNGALWLDGITHILKPRLFFPNKTAIDDSQKTMEYTGLMLAGAEQGTSISLGYMAESYVDFGRYFFVIPIILLGLFIGWLFKLLFNSGINILYCWAFSVPFYFQFYGFEMASEKVLGAIVTYAIVVFILVKFFSKRFVWLEK